MSVRRAANAVALSVGDGDGSSSGEYASPLVGGVPSDFGLVGIKGDVALVTAPVIMTATSVCVVVVLVATLKVGSPNRVSASPVGDVFPFCVGFNGDVAFTVAPVRVATISVLVVVSFATVKVGSPNRVSLSPVG